MLQVQPADSINPARSNDGDTELPAAGAFPRPVSAARDRYSVTAEAGPSVVARVLDLFAKRGVVTERLWADRFTRPDGGDTLRIGVEVEGLSDVVAAHIARCLGQIHGVVMVARECRDANRNVN